MDIKIAVVNPSINEVRNVIRPLEKDYVIHYFTSFEQIYNRLEQNDLLEEGAKDASESVESTDENSKENTDSGDAEEQSKREYDAQASLSPIDLVIVDMELLEQYSPKKWLDDTQEKLKSLGATPPGDITKFIFTTFERDDLHVSTFQHPFLYDLIFKPLDQPLVLQKVEMIAHLPKISSPGHLYSHKTEGEVIVTKECPMVEMHEYGVTVLNPSPASVGTFANFRLPYKNEGVSINFIGRCVKSAPSEIPDYYKNTFIYFGMESADLRHQRIALQKLEQTVDPYKTGNIKKEEVVADPSIDPAELVRQRMLARAQNDKTEQDAAAAPEDPTPKDVVLIDMDRVNVEATESSFKQNFPNAHLHTFPTFIYFTKYLIDKKKKNEAGVDGESAERWTENAFSFGNTVSLEIDLDSNELKKMHPSPRDHDTVFGHEGPFFSQNPLVWKSIVDEEESEEFDEILNYTALGEKSEMDFKLTNSEGKKRWFSIVAAKNEAGNLLLKITDESLKNVGSSKAAQEEVPTRTLEKIDLVIVNTAYIPSTLDAWQESFMTLVNDHGLRPAQRKIEFIFLNPEGAKFAAKDFCKPDICGFFSKPVDRRLFAVCVGLSMKVNRPEFKKSFLSSLPWNRKIEIGRPVKTLQISEYGLIMTNKKAMRPGTLINLHSDILTDEDGEGTEARCLGYEKSEDKKDMFILHFLYYGVMDRALKRIRQTIREEYVQKKEK